MKKTINLSVKSVNDAERTLEAATIISVGIAKGHTYEGLPVHADQRTLNMVADIINNAAEQPYVNLDHSSAVGSKIGRILDARVFGNVVVSSLQFLEVAFTDALNKIGAYIFGVAKEDSDLIGCSLEMETEYEIIDDRAYLRPVSVLGVSVCNDPAFQTKLALFNKHNINTLKESHMSEKLKTEVKPEDKPVAAPEAAPAAPEAAPEAAPTPEEKPEEADMKVKELAAQVETMAQGIAKILAWIEAQTSVKAEAAPAAPEAAPVKVEASAKPNVKLVLMSDISETKQEDSEEDIKRNWKRYLSDPAKRDKVLKFVDKLK